MVAGLLWLGVLLPLAWPLLPPPLLVSTPLAPDTVTECRELLPPDARRLCSAGGKKTNLTLIFYRSFFTDLSIIFLGNSMINLSWEIYQQSFLKNLSINFLEKSAINLSWQNFHRYFLTNLSFIFLEKSFMKAWRKSKKIIHF